MRDAILKAADRVFSTYGYHDAKVAMIAQEAGVAVGTIYRFFSGKDELYREVVRMKLFDMERRIVSAISDKSPLDALRAYIHEAFAFFEENKDFFKFFLRDVGTFSVADLEKFGLSSWYDGFINKLTRMIDKGKEKGIFKDFDSKVVMLFLSGAVKNLVYSEAKGRIKQNIDSIEETIFRIITEGIKK